MVSVKDAYQVPFTQKSINLIKIDAFLWGLFLLGKAHKTGFPLPLPSPFCFIKKMLY